MIRRGFLKSLVGGVAGLLGLRTAAKAVEPGKPTIQGVGVLRCPSRSYIDENGNERLVQDLARQLVEQIKAGDIVVLPNTVNEHGWYEWDYHIEPGNPEQFRVEVMGISPDDSGEEVIGASCPQPSAGPAPGKS